MTAADKHAQDYPAFRSDREYKQELHDLQVEPVRLQKHKPERGRWSLADIPYDTIDPTCLAGDPYLFYMLAAASLVEINSDLYTRNLLEYFHGDTDVTHWLTQDWQHEEIQHGAALRRYVNTVWPDFDWDRSFQRFSADYARLCHLRAPGGDNICKQRASTLWQTVRRTAFRLQYSNSCCLFSRDEEICLVQHPARNTDDCSAQAETGKGILI